MLDAFREYGASAIAADTFHPQHVGTNLSVIHRRDVSCATDREDDYPFGIFRNDTYPDPVCILGRGTGAAETGANARKGWSENVPYGSSGSRITAL